MKNRQGLKFKGQMLFIFFCWLIAAALWPLAGAGAFTVTAGTNMTCNNGTQTCTMSVAGWDNVYINPDYTYSGDDAVTIEYGYIFSTLSSTLPYWIMEKNAFTKVLEPASMTFPAYSKKMTPPPFQLPEYAETIVVKLTATGSGSVIMNGTFPAGKKYPKP